MYELEVVFAEGPPQVLTVENPIVVGRGADCEVRIPNNLASRRHARFEIVDSRLQVSDLGSSNGTYLNGVLATREFLKPGDLVTIGSTEIRVREKGVAPPAPAKKPAVEAPASSSERPSFRLGEADVDGGRTVALKVSDLMTAADPAASGRRLEAVLSVSRALADIRDLPRLFDTALKCLVDVFPQADRGFLLLGGSAESLVPQASYARGRELGRAAQVSTSICRKAIESSSAILYDYSDLGANVPVGASVHALGIRSALAIPLVLGDTPEGVLLIDSRDARHPFSPDDLALAAAVSQQVAIAIHNGRLLERVEKETTIRNNLARFLPRPLVDQAIKGEIALALGGTRCAGTVLFSDVVGFTRLSEGIAPEEVVTLMNRYFEQMVPCIHDTSGAIDKYMGDAIMAFWGIPFASSEGARDASRAALLMQNALVELNAERGEGALALAMGIGLNSGPVVAGNIGSADRVEYTILGDTVNTAQRLESTASAHQILVSSSTRSELGKTFRGIRMPPLSVKNKALPLDAFSLRGLVAEDGSVLLHVPVDIGVEHAHLVRRTAEGLFELRHSHDLKTGSSPLVTAMVEWAGKELGVPSVVSQREISPGRIESKVRLADPSLSGLLGDTPPATPLGWGEMLRSKPS